MTGVRTLICGVGLVVVGAAPAAAEDRAPTPNAPRSLRMRPGKRVGQVPAPDQPQATDDVAPPSAPPDAAMPEATVAPAPVVAAPAPTITATATLSASELAQLSAAATPAITVTGSLIERATQTTPSALTILTRDELLAAGRTMIGDILQPLPEQGNAINAQFNNGGDGSTRIDIRGLGVDRTLVLLNGRRFVPGGTGADSTVDLNTIPLAVIDRVEVLKDAASAVYGSGAIGGVVNIITRTSFTGTEASLYTGQSQRGDGFTYDASFITGHSTENHDGNIIVSAGIQSQDPVFAGDRAFSQFDKVFDFTTRQASNSGSTSIPGGRIDATKIDVNGDGQGDPINICGAGVRLCTSNGMGGFRPFVAPADLYNFQPINFLYTPSSRFNAYTAGHYKIRSNVSGFFEASYLHRESDQQLAPEPFAGAVPISRDSIYNPFGGDVFDYRRRLEEFGPRATHQSIDTLRTVVGIQGGMPDDVSSLQDWKWELSYNMGRTDGSLKNTGNLILSHVQNAVGPSFLDSSGTPRCGTPSAPIFGCVPMNILGASGSISPEAVAYSAFTGLSTGFDQEHTVLATAHGKVARLPNNGDISAAVSTDFRKESAEFTPDPLIVVGDTTGNADPATSGSFHVLEAAAEVSIVPARDQDGLERLELDLAARAFRYERFGGVTSNARALVRPIRGVTVRATYATSFREPSVLDMFQGKSDNFPFAQDPCDHALGVGARTVGLSASSTEGECAREGVPPDAMFGTFQQHVVNHGNPDLNPETAKVLTAGVVVEPVPGLALSVDYWNIDVAQAIQQANINAIFASCYQRGIRSFCDQIRRDPMTHAIDFVDGPTANLGGTATAGIDVAAVYDRDAHEAGKLHVRAEAQRLLKFDVDNGATVVHGLGVYDLGVYPTTKASLAASWQHPSGVGAGFNLHLIGSFLECENNDCSGTPLSRTVDAYAKVDVFGSYAFKGGHGQTLITIGVNNVFDRDPSLIYVGFAGDSDAATYDYLGRFFYARVTQLF
jgi:iron complex outermembrane recepter protein